MLKTPDKMNKHWRQSKNCTKQKFHSISVVRDKWVCLTQVSPLEGSSVSSYCLNSFHGSSKIYPFIDFSGERWMFERRSHSRSLVCPFSLFHILSWAYCLHFKNVHPLKGGKWLLETWKSNDALQRLVLSTTLRLCVSKKNNIKT